MSRLTGIERLTMVLALLVISVFAAAPSADWSSAQVVTVIETDYRFEPNHLILQVGVPYRLRLENQGAELHEFTAPAFFKAVELGNPDALNPERTEILLQPGDHKDLYFIAKQAARYPFFCADHDWAGMTGEIVVQ